MKILSRGRRENLYEVETVMIFFFSSLVTIITIAGSARVRRVKERRTYTYLRERLKVLSATRATQRSTTIERGGNSGKTAGIASRARVHEWILYLSLALRREKRTCAPCFHSGNRPLSFATGMEYKRVDFCRDDANGTTELWSLAEYEIRQLRRTRASLAFRRSGDWPRGEDI